MRRKGDKNSVSREKGEEKINEEKNEEIEPGIYRLSRVCYCSNTEPQMEANVTL